MNCYIYGAGGHGKVVLDAMLKAQVNCSGFVDDRSISTWAGLNVHSLSNLTLDASTYLHLAIGSCKTRESLATTLHALSYFNVIHPSAVIATTSIIGSGSFFAAQSIIGPDAKIGNHCIVNHAAVVDHDCVVGDFSHIAPHAGLGGGVRVGKGVLIGAGAVVLPRLTIEDYAVIGAGAVVTKNVSAGLTVVGNPAQLIK